MAKRKRKEQGTYNSQNEFLMFEKLFRAHQTRCNNLITHIANRLKKLKFQARFK